MRVKTGAFRANRVWALVFAFWLLLLSGAFAPWGAPPGIVQSLRLNSLLATKREQLARVQKDIDQLQRDAILLEQSKVAQHREIRKVLGYAAPDEIIFDFSDADSL